MTINAQYRVTAMGAYAPERILTNHDLERMVETNDEWTVARRYMSLETLARVTNTPTVRLPAVAS